MTKTTNLCDFCKTEIATNQNYYNIVVRPFRQSASDGIAPLFLNHNYHPLDICVSCMEKGIKHSTSGVLIVNN